MTNRSGCPSNINSVETMRILSDAELTEKLLEGKRTPLSECIPESEISW